MQRKDHTVAKVRRDLTLYSGQDPICNATWARWRSIAGIKKSTRYCEKDQWAILCACFCLRIDGKAVNEKSVEAFIIKNPDPLKFLPGYIPTSMTNYSRSVDGGCRGHELADRVWQGTGQKPSERTIRRWLEVLHLPKFDRYRMYEPECIQLLRDYQVAMRHKRQRAGFRLVEMKRVKGRVEVA